MQKAETDCRLTISRIRSPVVLFFVVYCACLYTNQKPTSAEGKEQEPYALLMGTCFDQKGFSLPGVTLVVQMEPPVDQKVKQQRWKMLSSPRGEFAVRLPAGKHSYSINASKRGFMTLEKTVGFEGEERRDIIFNMEPLSEKK
jgi:hypothetical protein